jgi:hypothetical protein
MITPNDWIRRVWHLINRPRRERELLREMRDHRASMDDPSRFGDTHRLSNTPRCVGWNWLDDAMQDLASVSAHREVSIVCDRGDMILTFGIGLNLTLFQLVRVGMLRPPALKQADSWVRFSGPRPTADINGAYPLTQCEGAQQRRPCR